MNKKLYVPEHVARKIKQPDGMEKIPKPLETAFGKPKEEENKNKILALLQLQNTMAVEQDKMQLTKEICN